MTDPRSDTSSHSDTGTLLAANLSGTPGITLRLAREKAGLTLNEVASQTKIPVPVLEAIEHDDTARLGQPVYVRGYLRKYANAMNIPESRVLTAFDSRQAARQPPPETPAEETEPVEERGGSQPMLWILLIVVLAAVAGAAVLYLKGGSLAALTRRPAVVRPAPAHRAPTQQPAPAPVEPMAEPPRPATPPAPQSAPAAPTSKTPASGNPAVPGGPPPVNQPEPGAVSPAPKPAP